MGQMFYATGGRGAEGDTIEVGCLKNDFSH
jgi:hypothetical protein